MIKLLECRAVAIAAILLLSPSLALAQHHPAAPPDTAGHRHGDVSRAATEHAHEDAMPMRGMYGPYPRTREASGTAWQPDAARHDGAHFVAGAWMAMVHTMADVVYDDQDGPRGEREVFGANMAMGMAQRSIGAGTFGVRAMVSAEPATIGKEGYPLLLQTGETADGRTPLIDRQHPHDFFMELAATFSLTSGTRSVFLYAGLPGEPALGPPAFMHRFSGASIPAAPLTHHWLDSSHITFGVLTAGAVLNRVKLEASAFRGQEPNEKRWDIESPALDSHAFRLSFNPTERWALQVSHGRLERPEQLEPEVDVDRTTASVMYERPWSRGRWEATLAWGRNRNRPGETLDGFALEAAAEVGGRHTFFGRVERVDKNELFLEEDPRSEQVYDVGAVTAGYRHDLWRQETLNLGIGAAGTLSQIPRALRGVYGKRPTSILLFVRAAI